VLQSSVLRRLQGDVERLAHADVPDRPSRCLRGCASLSAARRFALRSLRSGQRLAPATQAARRAAAVDCDVLAASASFVERVGQPARTRVLGVFNTPIPSRGYGVHLNITHGALCAAHSSRR
jgi:hypothetical protein